MSTEMTLAQLKYTSHQSERYRNIYQHPAPIYPLQISVGSIQPTVKDTYTDHHGMGQLAPDEDDSFNASSEHLDLDLVKDIGGRMILHWNYRNLIQLPDELIQHGDHIKEIYLKKNRLTTLPKGIHKLASLTNLYLIGNEISTLPEEISTLENLKVLDLSQNSLDIIPSGVMKLPKLEQLLITQNSIAVIPTELGRLKSLKFLELSANKIGFIPHEVILGLKYSLEELSIDDNLFTSLPRNITSLQNLRYLSACKCNILYLPATPFHMLINGRRRKGSFTPRTAIPEGLSDRPLSDFEFLFDGNRNLNYIPYWMIQIWGTKMEIFGCGVSKRTGITPPVETKQELQIRNERKISRSQINFQLRGSKHRLHFDEDLMLTHRGETTKPPALLELCLRAVYLDGLHLLRKIDRNLHEIKEPLCVKHLCQNSDIASPLKTLSRNANLKTLDVGPSALAFKMDDMADGLGTGSREAPELEVQGLAASSSAFAKEDAPPLLPTNLRTMLDKGAVAACFKCMKPIFTESWLMLFRVPQMEVEIANDAERLPQRHRQSGDQIEVSCVHFCTASCYMLFSKLVQEGNLSKYLWMFDNRVNF